MEERYYSMLGAAAARGAMDRLGSHGADLPPTLLQKPLAELSVPECEALIAKAHALGIKTHYFKRSDRMLPRVHCVMGFLKSISFISLLDVGSGRGAFLFPFLDAFSWVDTYAVDILDRRIEMLSDIARGGVARLQVLRADICDQPLADRAVDVVTLLEVLEHIPNVEAAVRSAVRMARQYVVVTVPSKEDNNPEHIHLLTRERLTALFSACGVTRLSFDAVPGHLVMIAKIGG